jgi:hypothetical protein
MSTGSTFISEAFTLVITVVISGFIARAVAQRQLSTFTSALAHLQRTLDRIEKKLNSGEYSVTYPAAAEQATPNGKAAG